MRGGGGGGGPPSPPALRCSAPAIALALSTVLVGLRLYHQFTIFVLSSLNARTGVAPQGVALNVISANERSYYSAGFQGSRLEFFFLGLIWLYLYIERVLCVLYFV